MVTWVALETQESLTPQKIWIRINYVLKMSRVIKITLSESSISEKNNF